MKITVTQEDIDLGEVGHPCNCPVALAIKREKPTSSVYVITRCVNIDGFVVMLPVEVTRFIESFEGAYPVSPFSFDLPI